MYEEEARLVKAINEEREFDGFTVEDHVRAIVQHAPAAAPDFVLANALPVSEEQRAAYRAKGAEQVMLGFGRSSVLPEPGEREVTLPSGYGRKGRLLAANVIDEASLVRHDSAKLAQVVLDIAASWRS